MHVVGTDRIALLGGLAVPAGTRHAVEPSGRVVCDQRAAYRFPALAWDEPAADPGTCPDCHRELMAAAGPTVTDATPAAAADRLRRPTPSSRPRRTCSILPSRDTWAAEMRRAPLVAALLGLAAAVAPTLAPATAAGERQFSPPRTVDPVHLAAEPSIVVAPDGTEVVVAPAGPGARLGGTGVGGDLLWRSTDHGRSWTRPGSYDLATGGADSDIAVTPDGTLYASGLTYPACASVSRSTDGGRTWLGLPMSGCARLPLANDRQWTATYGDDVVYTVIGDVASGHLELLRSAVSAPVVVASPPVQLSGSTDYQWPGTVAVDQRNGRVYAVWNTVGAPNDCDGSAGASDCAARAAGASKPDRILVARLGDGATRAPRPVVVASRRFDTFDSFAVVTVDRAGRVYVVWSERHPRARATRSMLATSRDGGATWSRPVRVNRSPATTTFPWVSAGDGGRIAVSYYGTAAHARSPQTVGRSAAWSVFSAYSTDGGRTFTEYRTTAAMHHGPICTSGTACPAGSRNLLDFFETAVDPAGCLVTAYADDTADPAAGAAVSYVRQTAGPGLRADRPCRRSG